MSVEPSEATDAAFEYGGALARAIARLKYEDHPEVAVALGSLLAARALPLAGAVDVVVPVPLHRERLVSRGYNQSSLLARPVARALGVPMSTHLLERSRSTSAQVGTGRRARSRNVEGAFVARLDARARPPRVLIIDDVRTTGATLRECVRAFALAGLHDVHALALASAND